MALSKSLVEVGISMVLRDGFSQQAGRISSSYASLMNDMNNWNRAVTQTAGTAFDYGSQMVAGMYDAYKHSAEVSNQIFMTSKIAGATAKQSKELMQIAQEVNMQTPLTNIDIASGERYLAMAGNSASAIKSMIGPAAKLASIFDMQLGGKGGVADLMTNVMATFGIQSSQANRTADILYTATTSANMNLTDLARALQYSGATFRNAGIDLQTASAAIGVLGDQGIQASSAGTALANMVRYLTLSITGQKTKGAQMLKALGISREDLVDAQGNLRDLGTLMKVLADKMKLLSGTSREAAMYNIFGVRGQRAASALFQAIWNGSDKMQNIIDKANNSNGAVDQVTKERMNTPQGRIDALNAAIDNLRVSLGGAMTAFTPLIRGIAWVANKFAELSTTGVGGFIVKIVTAGTMVFTVTAGFRLLFGTIKMVTTMMGVLNASTQSAGTATGRMVSGAVQMEIHLQRMVALMAEYVALSYAPGTRGMMLPGGGRLGRNKLGKPYVTMNGKNYTTANYAATGAPAPPTGGAGGGSNAGSNVSGGLGLAGMASMMFGGPWGIGIGLALTGLSVGLDYYMSSVDANTEALEANTQELTAQEIQQKYNEAYIKAMQAAVKGANGNNSNSLNLTINGVPVGNFRDGDSVSVDSYGFTY